MALTRSTDPEIHTLMKIKYIYLVIGDAGNGKTTFTRLFVQKTGMLDDPNSAVIDADEKQGLIKLSKLVTRYPLRNREDFRRIESLLSNRDLLWIDTPGTSRIFIGDAIKDPQMFARYGINIIPVLLIGNRGSSMEVAQEWMDSMQSLPIIYVIHNPKRLISNQEKTVFETTVAKLKGPTKKVIMHMPPLDADIAKELEKIGCSLEKIINGEVDPAQSETLSHYMTMIDVESWKTATDAEFAPLYDAVKASGDIKKEPDTMPQKSKSSL